ncbi:uncharacterized protein IL334_004193 [Kwoniella shivajii]|uniref:AAA+ ATPase domain-containing protein n=1 Tax=Kwoniella shivajii TaxID=564305 RepID=A0ABZ1D3P7_9TREE|nr:hypothetical protein IL334_004193 [Kwoniella shivajii]
MASYLHALTYGDDVFGLPSKLISSLSRHQNMDSFAPLAIRAIALGAILTVLKRFIKYGQSKINRILFPTAYIAVNDPAFHWITSWIAQDPYAQSQIHDFQLSTTESRSLRKKNNQGVLTVGDTKTKGTIGEHNASWKMNEIIGQILPTYQHSIRIKHDGNYLWVTRRITGFAGVRQIDHFRVRTIAFRPQVLRQFLVAARNAFFAKEERELLIFHAKRIQSTWQVPVSRPARPWSSVILPGDLKDEVLKDIEKFLSDKETHWYASRGIPHRRGYLFHGAPGSGKTTLVTAIASKLALDIYVINPAQRGMDDAKMSKLFRDCPARSVILIEDIDCIFPRGRGNRIQSDDQGDNGDDGAWEDGDGMAENNESVISNMMSLGGKHNLAPSTVTMSGLLNAIDGVSSQEGCILIATTNHPNRLDPALSRAGRFDIRLEFTWAIPSQAKALYLHFYPLDEFQPFPNTSPPDDGREDTKTSEKLFGQSEVVISNQKELDNLADAFVEGIFNLSGCKSLALNSSANDNSQTPASPTHPKLSMASLQSYLLQHKEDPISASEVVKEWIKQESNANVSHHSTNVGEIKWGLRGRQVEDDDYTLTSNQKVRSVCKSQGKVKLKKAEQEGSGEKKAQNAAAAVGDIAEIENLVES